MKKGDVTNTKHIQKNRISAKDRYAKRGKRLRKKENGKCVEKAIQNYGTPTFIMTIKLFKARGGLRARHNLEMPK